MNDYEHLSYKKGREQARAYLMIHTMGQALTDLEAFTTDTAFNRGFRDLIIEIRQLMYEEN